MTITFYYLPRKTIMKLKTTLLLSTLIAATAQAKLDLQVYHADSNSFSVNSTLITGEKEAIVVDTGFTRADALRIASKVLDSNKTLTTIFISQADPDYYFGAETLKQLFPNAKVVSTPAVIAEIKHKLAGKMEYWSPKMGANAPKQPIVPDDLGKNSLTLEGETIEIKGTTGTLANRPYLWIPSLKAIAGNVGVYGNMHVWTADSQTKAERDAWIAQLKEMKALQPTKVIPGHMSENTPFTAETIDFTQRYLETFENALAKGKNSEEVISLMDKAYPNLADKSILELGAKVNKGEMKW